MEPVLTQAEAENTFGTAKLFPTFIRHARRTPDRPAIICDGKKVTYRELVTLSCRWSNAMARRGVKRGDQIGVLLPNSIEFVALMLVSADLGAGLVPLNTSLPSSAVYRAFEAAAVKHVVSTATLLKSLWTTSRHSVMGHLGATDSAVPPDFSIVDGLWVSLDDAIEGAIRLEDLLQDVSPDVQPLNMALGEDALILTMTSGSTGDPKPIILTQRTKFNRVNAAVELYDITETDRILTATPLYHSLAERLVLIPLMTGGTSVLMSRFSVSEWFNCVRQHAVTFTIAVSSQLKQISELLGRDNAYDISSLRCVVSSSAALETNIKSELLTRLNCEFHECYGTSEIGIASNLASDSVASKVHSVGTPAPGVDIKIIGKDDELVGDGETGEIVCKTPMLFGGYFERSELTRTVMWGEHFRTGDLGRLDEDGFLYFLGRAKDIIICGGINIYPLDIEAAVNQHASVLESAAFAFPDERLGEVVAIAVAPVSREQFDLRALRLHCCECLADFQQPREFFVVDALPRNGMGKVMKLQLIDRFAQCAP